MSVRTVSEQLFEQHCDTRSIARERIDEDGKKVADYRLPLSIGEIVAEIKQLDPNKDDLAREALPSGTLTGMVVSPARRVRGLLASAYLQIKPYASKGIPGIVVCYNNAGFLTYIDNFTVTRAMLGGTAVRLALDQAGVIRHVGQQFTGGRTATRNTCRGLSAVCVLSTPARDKTKLVAYHNPYASNPIAPSALTVLADEQYGYGRDPHGDPYTQLLAHRLEV